MGPWEPRKMTLWGHMEPKDLCDFVDLRESIVTQQGLVEPRSPKVKNILVGFCPG